MYFSVPKHSSVHLQQKSSNKLTFTTHQYQQNNPKQNLIFNKNINQKQFTTSSKQVQNIITKRRLSETKNINSSKNTLQNVTTNFQQKNNQSTKLLKRKWTDKRDQNISPKLSMLNQNLDIKNKLKKQSSNLNSVHNSQNGHEYFQNTNMNSFSSNKANQLLNSKESLQNKKYIKIQSKNSNIQTSVITNQQSDINIDQQNEAESGNARQNLFFLTNQNSPKDITNLSKDKHLKPYPNNFSALNSKIHVINNLTPQIKWEKVIQLYTLKQQLSKKYQFTQIQQLKKSYPILPGKSFYKIFIKNRTFQKQWKINFPQTIFLDSYSNIVMVYTDPQSGILKRKLIQKEIKQKDDYKQEILKFKEDFISDLQKFNKKRLFKQIKVQQNPNIPLTIIKSTQNNIFQFQTDVHSYRNFIERKKKPSRDSIVQRYIYSNDLKAMVFRLIYRRTNPALNRLGPQYQGIKFQNQKPIFRQSGSTSFAQIHKLTTTISLSSTRIGSMKVNKINNPKALQKFIVIAKQLQKMLQYNQKVIINSLYIDFIVDIFEKPWVINIKYCQVSQINKIQSDQLKQKYTSNVSSCRLCGAVQRKQNLKNSVSVKMLCQFISHLKKRTKYQEQHKIDFINNLNINSKQNKTSLVCKVCYKVIIHQLQLIKMQQKLAQICNIIPQNDNQFIENNTKNELNLKQYKQWRLMLYFEDIKNVNQLIYNYNNQTTSMYNNYANNISNRYKEFYQNNFNKKQFVQNSNNIDGKYQLNEQNQFLLKYQLCPKITQNFKCKKQNSSLLNNLNINQVKLHYFYSETTNIEQFINNTQINVSLYALNSASQNLNSNSQNPYQFQDHVQQQKSQQQSFLNERLIASGSTHILSTFNLYKSSSFSLKALMQNGQRQTATVLLFFKNKKYCELTLKVGLVYDGSYNVSNIPIKGENNQQFSNFIKWNQVWFSKTQWNSNPLPKQWMEIFGSKYNYNTLNSQIKNENKQEQSQQKMLEKILQNRQKQFDIQINDI